MNVTGSGVFFGDRVLDWKSLWPKKTLDPLAAALTIPLAHFNAISPHQRAEDREDEASGQITRRHLFVVARPDAEGQKRLVNRIQMHGVTAIEIKRSVQPREMWRTEKRHRFADHSPEMRDQALDELKFHRVKTGRHRTNSIQCVDRPSLIEWLLLVATQVGTLLNALAS